MPRYTTTENKQLTSLRAAEFVSLVYIQCKPNLEASEHAFSEKKTDFSDTPEICYQGVYIDVSQTKHVIMQMKTLDYMLKVNTKILSLDHSLIGKAHKPY